MSDLTITTAGVSESKVSGGEFLSADKKLNQMKIDLIDVTLTTDIEAINDNDVIAQSIEIPNAVAVKGGSAVIQSILLLDEDEEAPTVELLFSQISDAISDDEGNAIGASVAHLDTVFNSLLGSTTISNWSDLVDAQIGVKTNIGLVIKGAAASTSIYVHAINRTGGDYTPAATTNLKMRIGILKD